MGKTTTAYTAPFLAFMLFLAVGQGLESAHLSANGLAAKYWIYPLQSVFCGGAVAYFWREYRMGAPRKVWLALAVAALVFMVWTAPQTTFHCPRRTDGFNPGIFAGRPVLYWGELVLRFARLVIVVPLLEEIFWRGFLLRYLINEDFESVPFGTYRHLANWVVALGFMLEHAMPDYPAALLAGLLYNKVAYQTRSLSSCVLAHAVTNALLGGYIMMTHQWGFW